MPRVGGHEGRVLGEYARLRGLLLDSQGPVAGGYVPLDHGATVLYGVNGAGKSYVLESIEACFRGAAHGRLGRREPALVVDFWRRPDERGPFHMMEAADYLGMGNSELDAFVRTSLRAELPDFVDLDEALPRVTEQLGWVVDVWVDSYSEYEGYRHDEEEVRELAEVMLAQWTFLLIPIGTTSRPQWSVRLAAFSNDHPLLAAHVEALKAWPESRPEHPVQASRWPARSASHELGHVVRADTTISAGLLGAPLCLQLRDQIDPNVRTQTALAQALWAKQPASDDPIKSVVVAQVKLADAMQGRRDDPDIDHPVRLFDEPGEPSAWALAWCRAISANSTAIFNAVLPHSPPICFESVESARWISEPMFHWVARPSPGGEPVPIDWLSSTEQRWAAHAIGTALRPRGLALSLLDEPEQGLHRAAEVKMADMLLDLASAGLGGPIVIATHSPAFLDDTRATVLKINRSGDGFGQLPPVQLLSEADRSDLRSWGLTPSDLLQQVRVLLLVEGEHEVAVLRGMLGSKLRRLGVELLPLDKGSKLADPAAATVLFRFSDAPVVAMLDVLPADELERLWREVTTILKRDGLQAARDELGGRMSNMPQPEGGWMRRFLDNALVDNREHRVVPWALSAADVLEYLPAERLLPGAEGWAYLKERAARNTGKALSGTGFKTWLKAQGADLSSENVRRVAEEVEIPAEIEQLLERLARAARGPR